MTFFWYSPWAFDPNLNNVCRGMSAQSTKKPTCHFCVSITSILDDGSFLILNSKCKVQEVTNCPVEILKQLEICLQLLLILPVLPSQCSLCGAWNICGCSGDLWKYSWAIPVGSSYMLKWIMGVCKRCSYWSTVTSECMVLERQMVSIWDVGINSGQNIAVHGVAMFRFTIAEGHIE